jgi:hypothetical protein
MARLFKESRPSLEEFQKAELPPEVERLLGDFNGGSFMQCHTRIYEQTGVWIDDLVPVFQRLDAALGLSDARPESLQR